MRSCRVRLDLLVDVMCLCILYYDIYILVSRTSACEEVIMKVIICQYRISRTGISIMIEIGVI